LKRKEDLNQTQRKGNFNGPAFGKVEKRREKEVVDIKPTQAVFGIQKEG